MATEVVAEVVGMVVAAMVETVVVVDMGVVATEVVAVDMEAEATEVPANLPIQARDLFEAFCQPNWPVILFWSILATFLLNLLTNSQLKSSGIEKLHPDVNGF